MDDRCRRLWILAARSSVFGTGILFDASILQLAQNKIKMRKVCQNVHIPVFLFWAAALMVLCVRVSKFSETEEHDRPWPNSLASRKHSNNEIRIDRIYFISLDITPLRRAFMEGWLGKQTIPFQRIQGKVGDPSDTCVKGKIGPKQCRGIAGVAKSEVSIIDNYNTTGLTLVFQDDFSAENITRLYESISVVPDDWDVLRFNCWGHIPSDFPFVHVETGNELGIKKIFETRHDREQPPCNETKETCWFCGGAHAMVWRGGESVQKLRKLWSEIPYAQSDCRLTLEVERYNIKSYCINFRKGGVVQKRIKGEITNIPTNDKLEVTESWQ
jgi:hypothetical protein